MLLDPINPKLPSCPDNKSSISSYLAYPSLSIIFAITSAIGIIIATVILLKFNSLRVFKRVIRQKSISNSFWIFWYFLFSIRAGLQATKYGVAFPDHALMEQLFALAVALAHGFSSFALSLSLNYQFKWRSNECSDLESFLNEKFSTNSDSPAIAESRSSRSSSTNTPSSTLSSHSHLNFAYSSHDSNLVFGNSQLPVHDFKSPPAPIVSGIYSSESTPFFMNPKPQTSKTRRCLNIIFAWEFFFVILLVLYLTMLFIYMLMPKKALYFCVIAAFIMQRVPSLVLAFLIILKHISSCYSESPIGPTLAARLLLLFATLFNIIADIPINTWAEALGKYGCILKVVSGVDIITLAIVLAQVFYFIMIILEFRRNVESSLWATALFPSN